MEDSLVALFSYGSAVGIAGLIAREIMKHFREAALYKQIDDLWTWHNLRDEDGVPVWYVRSTLENAITQLSANIALQTKLMEKLVAGQDKLLNERK